jgi:predicted RNase H-related nuclease YkuK (DUF458 family)
VKYLTTSRWLTLSGKKLVNIEDRIRLRFKEGIYTFHVGTDSKVHHKYTVVTTTICFREPGRGVLVAYQRNKIDHFNNVLERLIHEMVVSIEAASMIRATVDVPVTIHADINTKKECLSNRVLSVIIGMAEGMGFSAVVKPDAWAADIADMFTR